MKSTVSSQPCVKELPFPKLMISSTSNLICLCTSASRGIAVGNTDSNNPVGKTYDTLNPAYWEDFHGSVCLENDK